MFDTLIGIGNFAIQTATGNAFIAQIIGQWTWV